ncbi:MAG: caspase family protein [Spirochaetia bacterium]|nr:caspase family protein [Spirochaetia bacterium]
MKNKYHFVSALVSAVLTLFFFSACVSGPPTHIEGPEDLPELVDYESYEENAPVEIVLQDGHYDKIMTISYSPDGSLILTASNDKTLKLWNSDGRLIRTFTGNEDTVSSAVFSPDGRYIACDSGNHINLWSIDGRLVRKFEGHTNKVLHLAFSPNGLYIASGGGDRTVRLWSIEGELLKTFTKHDSFVSGLCFSPDGRYIASSGGSRELGQIIKVYATSGQEVARFGHEELEHFFFSRDGTRITFLTKIEVVRGIYNGMKVITRGLKDGYEREIEIDEHLRSLAVSPDGEMIAGGTFSNTLKIWDRNWNKLHQLPRGMRVNSLSFSPDGKSLVYAEGEDTHMESDHTFSLVDLSALGTEDDTRHIVRTRKIRGYLKPATDMAVTSDGKFFAHSMGRIVNLWNTSRKKVRVLGGYSKEVSFVEFAENSELLLAGSRSMIKVWDTRGQLVTSFGRYGVQYKGAHFLQGSGGLLCTTSQDGIEVRSIEGDIENIIEAKEMKNFELLSVSPDGRFFLMTNSGGDDIHLWTIEGSYIRSFKGHDDDVMSLAFGPDGNYFVSGGRDRKVIVWDLERGAVKILSGFSNKVTTVAFSRDGHYVAGGGSDRRTRVWNTKDYSLETEFEQKDEVVKVGFVTGSVASISRNGTIMIRDLSGAKRGYLELTAFTNGEWFVRHSGGSFDCSSKGYEHLRFVKGLSVIRPDQLWERFFSPDLVISFLRGDNPETRNFEDVYDSVPKVAMKIERHYGEGDPRLEVTVAPRGDNTTTGDYFILHNGRIVDEKVRGIEVVASEKLKRYTITLNKGKNTVQAGIYDKTNTVYGISGVEIIYYEPKHFPLPDMHILSVGVSTYRDAAISLKSPSQDAQELAEVIREIGDKLYDEVEVKTLIDQEGIRESILGELEKISAQAVETDVVILFLAGHGFVEDGIYYFLPYDTDIIELAETAISVENLGSYVKKIPAKKIAVFLDTCQSGAAVKSLGRMAMSRSIDEERQIARLAKAQGIAVFSASAADEYAYEIPQLGNGIFTYSIIETLKTKRNEIAIKGNISLGKLLSSVQRITSDTAYKYLGIEQSPSMYMFGDDFYLGQY